MWPRYDGAGRDGFRAPPLEGLSVEDEEMMQQKAIYRLLKEVGRAGAGWHELKWQHSVMSCFSNVLR